MTAGPPPAVLRAVRSDLDWWTVRATLGRPLSAEEVTRYRAMRDTLDRGPHAADLAGLAVQAIEAGAFATPEVYESIRERWS